MDMRVFLLTIAVGEQISESRGPELGIEMTQECPMVANVLMLGILAMVGMLAGNKARRAMPSH